MNALLLSVKLYAKKAVTFVVGLLVGTAFAASTNLTTTPFAFAPQDEGVLDASITAAATSLTVSPIRKYVNGTLTTGCFNSGSGFLLVSSVGGRYEYMSFNGNACAANITTLSNLRRGLSVTASAFTAGTGLAWDAGSKIKVVDYPLLYQNATYKDLVNEFVGSGQLTSNQVTQAFLDANSVTTAQRNAFTFLNDGNIIYNSTLGNMQYRANGSWISFGSGSTINATATAAGQVRIATGSDLYLLSRNSSPYLALTTQNLILTSSGSRQSGSIVLTNPDGFLDVQAGGTGTGEILTGALLIGRGADPPYQIRAASHSGMVLKSDGRTWKAQNLPVSLFYRSATGSATFGASSTAESTVASFVIPANSVSVNDIFEIHAAGNIINADGASMRIKVGSATGARLELNGTDFTKAGSTYTLLSSITINKITASGRAFVSMATNEQEPGDESHSAYGRANYVAFDSTAAVTIALTYQPLTSNAANLMTAMQFYVIKYSLP